MSLVAVAARALRRGGSGTGVVAARARAQARLLHLGPAHAQRNTNSNDRDGRTGAARQRDRRDGAGAPRAPKAAKAAKKDVLPTTASLLERMEKQRLPEDTGGSRIEFRTAGRFRGIEMAKRVVERPLDIVPGGLRRQSVDSNIEYFEEKVLTPFGVVGIKVVGQMRADLHELDEIVAEEEEEKQEQERTNRRKRARDSRNSGDDGNAFAFGEARSTSEAVDVDYANPANDPFLHTRTSGR